MTLHIGDRVVACAEYDGNSEIIGVEGTIIYVVDGYVSVQFDEDVGGHDAGGRGEDGYCWDFYSGSYEEYLRPVAMYGPPEPPEVKVIRKCKHLWNKSRFVKAHPTFAY